jgi:hypothetical protein
MSTSESDTRLADLLTSIRDHLLTFELPEPYGVQAHSHVSGSRAPVSVHLAELGLFAVAGVLVAWVDTLGEARLSVWRPPSSDAVHVQVSGRLAGNVPIEVWAGVKAPRLLASLEPGQKRTLRLGLLRSWTAPSAAVGEDMADAQMGGAP